jgi:hypothetical protein
MRLLLSMLCLAAFMAKGQFVITSNRAGRDSKEINYRITGDELQKKGRSPFLFCFSSLNQGPP